MQKIAEWEDISNIGGDNAYNPPDLKVKVPKKGKQKIAERVTAGGQAGVYEVRGERRRR